MISASDIEPAQSPRENKHGTAFEFVRKTNSKTALDFAGVQNRGAAPNNSRGGGRILVTRIDRIGDVVLSTPVFSAIKERYPSAYVAAMVAASNRDLVEGNPYIDEVILYDKGSAHALWRETYRFARSLSRYDFDTVINLHATHRAHWISFLAGIPRRLGYRRKSHYLLTESLADVKWQGERHESEYNFDLLKFIDVPEPEEKKLYLPLNPAHKETLDRFLKEAGIVERSYMVIHPGASCPSRIWKAERYARIADLLSRRWGLDVVLVSGGGSDHIFSQRVQMLMRTPAVDLGGKLTLGTLAWLLKGARLMLSNDTGPVHMAAALDVPLVAIFGRNLAGLSPRRWRPLGPNSFYVQKDVGCLECAAHRCNLGFLCLDELTTEEVLAELEKHEACVVG